MFQFPLNPVVGQTFTPTAGVTFRWNGTAWFLIAGPGAFISQAEADARYVELTDPRPPVNAIINGDFQIWQRGTVFSPAVHPSYTADRWQYAKIGTAVNGLVNGPGVPSVAQAGRVFNGALLITVTTAQAVVAAGDVCVIAQNIEGYQFALIAQRPLVLSFWVYSSKSGTHCVALAGGGHNYVAEYTVNSANTWERKVILISPTPAAGTWNYTNGLGMALAFTLMAGATYNGATAGVWQSTQYYSTAAQVNLNDNTANVFSLQGVDLRHGTDAPAVFESRPFAEELALCQRYFSKSFAVDTAPGTAEVGSNAFFPGSAVAAQNGMTVFFPVRMRASPTFTFYAPVTGTIGSWRRNAAGLDTPMLRFVQGEASAVIAATGAVPVGDMIYGHWTANAEL